MTPIAFDRAFIPRYGISETVSPRIRRVLAENPGPFTFAGTGTYLVGQGDGVAVIDPGPPDIRHLRALLAAIEGERVSHVLVTHGHADHLPLARDFARATQAPVLADARLSPDQPIVEGEGFTGAGWTLTVMATPGHAPEHLSFVLEEENALFSGDHVMGWSTTVVAPPEGDMEAYLHSLDRVMAARFDVLWPTHGGPIRDPAPFLEALKAHRLSRESQILGLLRQGPRNARDMVPGLYAGVDTALWPAAAQSLLAHLIRLERLGQVTADQTDPSATTAYRLRA